MNKIKKAQILVDQLLDECSCDAGKPMDQEEVAFQKDTLFDDPERIVKDKIDDDPSLNPVPNTESIVDSIANRLSQGAVGRYVSDNIYKDKNVTQQTDKPKVNKPKMILAKNESISKSLSNVMKEEESISALKVSKEMERQKINPVSSKIKNSISEIFGLSAEEREKASKEADKGSYAGNNPILKSRTARAQMMKDALKG